MSIADILEDDPVFKSENNIRLAIAGLAICKFAPSRSEIRFLRHVDKHKLKLTIIPKLASGEIVDKNQVREYTLGNQFKSIYITGAEATTGFEYKSGSYSSEYPLKMMMDLCFLHGHRLGPKAGTPSDEITVMSMDNCLFYTTKLTDDDYDLVKNGSPLGIKRKFGEILGGYMKVADNNELTITIPGLIESPIKLPVMVNNVKYHYDIQFNNSCYEADGTPCKFNPSEPTDFLKIYDILEDTERPFDKFDLRKIEKSQSDILTINTGACLPVVEEPNLNG